jgi:peptide/nickel transport system permease protein
MTWGWFWRRLVSLGAVLLLVSIATYLLVDLLPGSPASSVLGPAATPEAIAVVEQDLNLDRPLPVRYAIWAGRAVRGDLGVSYISGEVVSVSLRERLPVSLELLLLTQLVATALAVPAALTSARHQDTRRDRLLSSGSFVALALPQFALGIALLIVFAQKLKWFPVADYQRLTDDPIGNIHSLVLPVVTLAVPLAAIYYRVLRTDLTQTLRSDHITFARAMGFSERRILLGRALRPSSLTLVSVVGLNTAFLLGGAVIIENLFSLPGLGRFALESVVVRDLPKIQGATLVIAIVYVVANLLVDVSLALLDPRVRLARGAT